MEYTIKVQGIDKAFELFEPKKAIRATQAALKETVKSGKVEASRAIRQDLKFNIKKSDLDRKISIKISGLQGEIIVTGRPIIMSYFNPMEIRGGMQTTIKKQKGRGAFSFDILKKGTRRKSIAGVQVQIIKGKKTILKGGLFRGGVKVTSAFIGRGKGGTPMVFGNVKVSKGKWQLWGYKVYSESNIFKKVMPLVIEKVNTQWLKEWDNAMKQLQTQGSWLNR